MDLLKDYNFEKVNKFLIRFDKILREIYKKNKIEKGKGLLFVDVNVFNNFNCKTFYVSINENKIFWRQPLKIRLVKTIIQYDRYNHMYLALVDGDITIFYER